MKPNYADEVSPDGIFFIHLPKKVGYPSRKAVQTCACLHYFCSEVCSNQFLAVISRKGALYITILIAVKFQMAPAPKLTGQRQSPAS